MRSQWKITPKKVPKGTVLGPLLSNIFLNDKFYRPGKSMHPTVNNSSFVVDEFATKDNSFDIHCIQTL